MGLTSSFFLTSFFFSYVSNAFFKAGHRLDWPSVCRRVLLVLLGLRTLKEGGGRIVKKLGGERSREETKKRTQKVIQWQRSR